MIDPNKVVSALNYNGNPLELAGGIEKTLLGTVTSPASNADTTDLVTIDYGSNTFDAILIERADGSGYGCIIYYNPTITVQTKCFFHKYTSYSAGMMSSTNAFYIQARESADSKAFTIGYMRAGGGMNMGYSKLFNVYACTFNFDSLLEV